MIITKIFCDIDDFIKELSANKKVIESDKKRRKSKLNISEVMTILVAFHNYGNRTFKDFYIKTVMKYMRKEFPDLVSYNRFIELIPDALKPLVLFLKLKRFGKSEKITFIDSTKIAICGNKRIKRNKTFKGIAKLGKSTMGRFFGFKLHIAINETGELVGANLSQGNVDDRNIDIIDYVLENVKGKLFGDKGYISQKLFEHLHEKGIDLVTNVRKNMKNRLMPLMDKLLLRKRSVIETVNDQLKNMCDIEHSRHRSSTNFFANLFAGLIRYTYFENKPSINFSQKDRDFLVLHSHTTNAISL